VRGGDWSSVAVGVSSSGTASNDPLNEPFIGIRLASQVTSGVPEIDPNSLGNVLALVLGSLGLLERRRLKAAPA